MAKPKRIPKPLERQLADLDHHLYILREQLYASSEGEARLKVLAAELRVLVCRSYGTDGLIWRLCRRLEVNDRISIQAVGGVKKEHPLAKGLQFAFVPVQRAGFGPPELPVEGTSFEEVVTTHEAVFVAGKGYTHEYLIKAVAQQMGSAHEDEGLEMPLVQLEEVLINGVYPYSAILARDAEFALEVGERVLEKAECVRRFERPARGPAYGNVSIALRLQIREQNPAVVPLLAFYSYVADVAVAAALAGQSLVFGLTKRWKKVGEVEAPYPHGGALGTDVLFILSYCSSAQRAGTLTYPGGRRREVATELGWLHASEMVLEKVAERDTERYYIQFIALYEKLLSSRDAGGLMELQPDQWGNWWSLDGQSLFLTEEDVRKRGIFPF